MAVTLEQAKLNVTDDIQLGVIDEFRKSNFLMNNLKFDDAVSPVGGGATLTYGYTRLKTQPTADFRAINSEYESQEAEEQRITVDLKVFGGSYKIDRVVSKMKGIINQVDLQTNQKIKAALALFNDTFINGDSAVDTDAFDGLEKALAGSSTEYIPTTAIDLSTSAAIDTNHKVFLDALDEFLMGLDGPASFIGGNTKLISKIRACARRSGMYQTNKNNFGDQVEYYGVTPLVDFGAKAGSNDPVIKILTGDDAGLTSLYAGRLGLDGIHGVSIDGQTAPSIYLPDFTLPGAVKTGEVEMIAAIALKATKAAGVMRKIKVA